MVQDRQAPLDVFVGRAAELARVAEVVARGRGGQPWLVAIEGEPGVGKTALARRILAGAGAADLKVLSARADQAEADLDFGLVDQLLRAAGAAFLVAAASGRAASLVVRRGRAVARGGGRAAGRGAAGHRDR